MATTVHWIHVTALAGAPFLWLVSHEQAPRESVMGCAQSPELVPQQRQQNGADQIAALTMMYVLSQGMHFVAGCTKACSLVCDRQREKDGRQRCRKEGLEKEAM